MIDVDIDECAAMQYQCSQLADCINTAGGYSCKCRSGFRGDGKTCERKPNPSTFLFINLNVSYLSIYI